MARLRNTKPVLGICTKDPEFKSRPISSAFLGTDNAVTVKVGDIVHFDWGGVNWGVIKSMVWNRGGEVLFIENAKGFTGDYIAGRTSFRFPAEHCYIAK